MDRDDHGGLPPRKGRPREDAGLSDGLEGVRRQIALETLTELAEEWGGESRTVEWLLRQLLARLREGE